MMLATFACGIIGPVIGIVDRTWKLGVTGWFTGGKLQAMLTLVVLANEYFARRQSS
tara:strand:+ start:373 stop:540 length:168 start_codon:yes stop_codon:yes gene_type:complete